jgi:hypothetical protein
MVGAESLPVFELVIETQRTGLRSQFCQRQGQLYSHLLTECEKGWFSRGKPGAVTRGEAGAVQTKTGEALPILLAF